MKVPVLTTVPALLCVLAACAGVTWAASPAMRGSVSITCEGGLPPKPLDQAARGRCTISGALTDAGTFTDNAPPFVTPHVRTFVGANGTLRISVYRERGNWRILEGTKAYAGLTGRGWERFRATSAGGQRCPSWHGVGCNVALTMVGSVFPRTIE